MSSVQLLDKTRKIGKLLHNNNSSKVVFNDICAVMTEILNSDVLVISRKGKVLGISTEEKTEQIHELLEDQVGGHIDSSLNERLLGILSTKENVNLETLGFTSMGSAAMRRPSRPSISPANAWGRCLFTVRRTSTISTTSFSASMALPWWGWR